MRSLIVLAVFSWSAVAAPVPKEVKKRDAVEGTWKLTKSVIDGRQHSDPENNIFWTIDKQHGLTERFAAKKDAPPAPRAMPNGWVMTSVPPVSVQLEFDMPRHEFDYHHGDFVRLGRYELRGDTLTIVLGLLGSARPNSLDDRENTHCWTWERVAK